MDTLSTFTFDTDVERDQLLAVHGVEALVSIQYLDIGGIITFSDLAQEKYIKNLETQNVDLNLQVIDLWESLLNAGVL